MVNRIIVVGSENALPALFCHRQYLLWCCASAKSNFKLRWSPKDNRFLGILLGDLL